MVAATDEDGDPATMYEHLGLGTPAIITLRYRLYAVTDDNGNTVGGRRISRAASETAIGKTIASDDTPDPQAEAPEAPQYLRAVAFSTVVADDEGQLPVDGDDNAVDNNQGLLFYWTHPENYPTEAAVAAEAENGDPPWSIQVQRRVPLADTNDDPGWQNVAGEIPSLPPAEGYATAQFSVNFTDPDAPDLWGESVGDPGYRVKYINPGATDDTDDDVNGAPANVTLPVVDDGYYRNTGVPEGNSTLPIIRKAASNGNVVGPTIRGNGENPTMT